MKQPRDTGECVPFLLGDNMTREEYMNEALIEAKKAFEENEVPIGAIVVCQGKIIGRAHNKREAEQLTTSHAEVLAIQEACNKIGSWKLDGCDLYVTTEPCMMCAGTIIQARIKNVYYAIEDKKAGFFGGLFDMSVVQGMNHYPMIHQGLLEDECKELLQLFFKKLRNKAPK